MIQFQSLNDLSQHFYVELLHSNQLTNEQTLCFNVIKSTPLFWTIWYLLIAIMIYLSFIELNQPPNKTFAAKNTKYLPFASLNWWKFQTMLLELRHNKINSMTMQHYIPQLIKVQCVCTFSITLHCQFHEWMT